MLEALTAYRIYKKENPKSEILMIIEIENGFVIVLKKDDREGFDVINKENGKIDFLWYVDWLDIEDSGKYTIIDISGFDDRGPNNSGPLRSSQK